MEEKDKELHNLRIENQLLQEEVDRLFNKKDVLRRLVNVFVLRPFKRLTKHAYRFLHRYDVNYQTEKFKPYVLKQQLKSKGKQVNVLHIINNFKTGGASRIVVDLIEGLPSNYNHTVVTRYNPIPQNYIGVEVLEYCDEPTQTQVKRLIDSLQPKLIHIHWGTMWSKEDSTWQWYYAFFKELELRSIPIIQNVNLPVVPYYFKRLDVDYIFVSNYVMQRYGGIHFSNRVIYPGSDLSFFERSELAPIRKNIGMVYRLDDHKLKESSIDPFVIAAKKDKDIVVHIVGNGDLKVVFEEKVKTAGLAAQFIFYSYVPYEELPSIYQKLELFIAPVFQESFGQVTPFAMSMGVPVLGYDTGAIAEIIGDPDCLVMTGKAEQLAQLILEKLNSPSWMKTKSMFNAQRAKLYALDEMVNSYAALYHDKLKVKYEN